MGLLQSRIQVYFQVLHQLLVKKFNRNYFDLSNTDDDNVKIKWTAIGISIALIYHQIFRANI